MFELTIKNEIYPFDFGIGFVRDISKTKQMKNEAGTTFDAGLQYAVLNLVDEDPLEVIEILMLANKTEKPRVNKKDLEDYIQDGDTNLEELCKDIIDFFKSHNATRKKTLAALEFAEVQKAKIEREKAEALAKMSKGE
jgi:DNA-directed RNA polymerase specialized sigma subunit